MYTCPLAAGCGLTIALALLGGCHETSSPSWRMFDPGTWGFQSIEDAPITIEVVGPTTIDVESFNGNVAVRADPLLKVATLQVTREAVHGHGRKDEALASLPKIQVSHEIVPGDMGQLLRIRTSTTHAEPHFQRAHITLHVPEVDGLSVRTYRGRVVVTGIEGEVFIKTTNADVELRTNHPMRSKVTIENRNGDIEYRVQGDSTAEFNCQSVRGSVDCRVKTGRLFVHGGTDHDTLLATLNDGVNPVHLRTADGDVRIFVVEDAFK